MAESDFFLAVELAGTGAHPASWRRADSRAEELFTGGYWVDAVTAVEKAGADAVFLPDSFGLQPGGPGVTRGRLDAVAIAARVAARTRRVGLLPQAPVTHTEPFHLAKAIQSLDFATLGRAGWEVTVSEGAEQAEAFGRKQAQDAASLWHEADEAVEVVTRLWDSWEDDAEIRDVPTGRFIDRNKLHYIDFDGDNFAVKGPSITPRSPQGQSIVAVRAHDDPSTGVAVRRADLIRIAAADLDAARSHRTALRTALRAADRDPDAVRVLLDLDVHLAESTDAARAEVAELEGWAAPPAEIGVRHLGTAATLRELLATVHRSAAADGVVLRPLAAPATLRHLPALGRTAVSSTTLRTRLGLSRPVSRYTEKEGASA
ncbi:LLM class flavin-dependent oxidoreductase [Nocardia brasiliensis]|uniref:LLM class flavin-dependent oxidoreductase n=1 Tax=Nocardia brasiliensis TaxID=37326 RepID=UPI0024548E86|nr:LLM class flavin-dependent oxidoreductase [Nocardia brasiliensis]